MKKGDLGIAPLIVSTFVSGIVGYWAISFLLKFLQKHTTYVFIFYRIILGAVLWGLLLTKYI
ncbi:MAG: hypothetical protein C0417_08125 [Chlorobiaceae bacterium]|nr:hypothetical protein [Chlorobiaceae bacterium]